jgi:hypothetical protein
MGGRREGVYLGVKSPTSLSLRSLQPGLLARKFLGTYRASPKRASIAFYDLREVANTAFNPTNTYFI